MNLFNLYYKALGVVILTTHINLAHMVAIYQLTNLSKLK